MELAIVVIVIVLVVFGLNEGWNQLCGGAALRRRKNNEDFDAGDEWGYKKVDGHYIHGDEPMICPLSGEAFYRWQWEEYNEKHGRQDLHRYMTEGSMMKLVSPNSYHNRRDEIKAHEDQVQNEEADRWNALTPQERQKEVDSYPTSSAPILSRINDDGDWEWYESGTWINVGSSDKTKVGGWDFKALEYGGRD